MNIENKLNNENEWKEIAKKMVDMCNTYNEYQKELLKFLLECYYEERKNSIIQNDKQAKLLASIIKNSND